MPMASAHADDRRRPLAPGHARALRTLVGTEQEWSLVFPRLANALTALYPRRSHEQRLPDAMLLAVPR